MFRACVIPLFVCLATVSTQERGPVQSPEVQPPIFSSRAELVVAHVTVKDRQGTYVTSLPEEAFRVFEDGAPQRIAFFTGEDSPVTVGFLVDSSGSMREGRERTTFGTLTRLAMSRRIQHEMVDFVASVIVVTDSARRSLRVRTRDGYRAGGPLLGS
jgi:hypothetical protein